MNPYEIDIENLKESEEVTEPKEILKYKIARYISDEIEKVGTKEAIKMTGINESDVSRLRVRNLDRFSLDRLLKILKNLKVEVEISVSRKNKKSAA